MRKKHKAIYNDYNLKTNNRMKNIGCLKKIFYILLIMIILIVIILIFIGECYATRIAFFIDIFVSICISIAFLWFTLLYLRFIIESFSHNKKDILLGIIVFVLSGFFLLCVVDSTRLQFLDLPQAISKQYSTYSGIIDNADFSNIGKGRGVKTLDFRIDDLKFSSSHKDIVSAIKYKGKYKIHYLQNTKYVIDIEYLGAE